MAKSHAEQVGQASGESLRIGFLRAVLTFKPHAFGRKKTPGMPAHHRVFTSAFRTLGAINPALFERLAILRVFNSAKI